MTDQTVDQNTSSDDPRVTVLQAVVDRVTSWHESATEDVVRKELDDALSEAGVDVDAETRDKVVSRIAHEHAEHFDVREVL
jgi:hypothetical protein